MRETESRLGHTESVAVIARSRQAVYAHGSRDVEGSSATLPSCSTPMAPTRTLATTPTCSEKPHLAHAWPCQLTSSCHAQHHLLACSIPCRRWSSRNLSLMCGQPPHIWPRQPRLRRDCPAAAFLAPAWAGGVLQQPRSREERRGEGGVAWLPLAGRGDMNGGESVAPLVFDMGPYLCQHYLCMGAH
jgi:hypothetical protein